MPEVFDPIRIGKMEIKNRIMFAPTMTNFANADGSVSDRQVEFLRRIAEGGTGIIIKGHAYVDDIASKGYKYMQGCHRAGLGLERIPKAVKPYDCACLLQLNHIGPKADPSLTKGSPRGPSPQVSDFTGKPVEIRMLTVEEIEKIVKAYGEAAARAEEAGFDGVEIHGAHNYLMAQFISPNFNFRNDTYGGSLEGRLTFPLEVLSSIKRHVSDDFLIGFRFNGEEVIKGGLPLEDGIKIAQTLEREGVDYLSVSQTSTVKLAAFTTTYHEPGSFIYIPATIKQKVSIPVAGVGALNEPEMIKRVLREKKMDIVAICRGLIAEPEIARKIKEDREDEERPCIRCSVCLERTWASLGIMCTVNPMVGRELIWDLKPASEKKRVMIVGGGVAGMEAARMASLKGHKVTLYEMSNRLGGQAFTASVPQFMGVFKSLIKYYETMLRRLNVEVKLGHKVSVDEINRLKPDAVVVATGAEEKIPDFPGAEPSRLTTGSSVLLGHTQVRGEVAVIGGSMIGCQVALCLAEEKSCQVKLISRRKRPDFASELEYGNQFALNDRIDRCENIRIHDQSELQEIKGRTLVLKKTDGAEEVTVDYVVFADEFVPRVNLLREKIDEKITVLQAGDCVRPKNLFTAIHQGASAAYKIAKTISA